MQSVPEEPVDISVPHSDNIRNPIPTFQLTGNAPSREQMMSVYSGYCPQVDLTFQ
jgi:hypothetical protein